MKIGVMQPYLFPYVGYFQLIKAVDKYVFYDDVNFIKGGWINRNKVLLNSNPTFFTIPLDKASPSNKILDTKINQILYPKWRKKFLRSIEQNYSKAKNFEKIFDIIESVLYVETSFISEISMKSITKVLEYLDIKKEIKISSIAYKDLSSLEREQRLISICNREKGDIYVNNLSGRCLYSEENFRKNGIALKFIENVLGNLEESINPQLSIIDLLMKNDKAKILEVIDSYNIVSFE